MDLRYAIPPILNVMFFFLSSWNLNPIVSSILVQQFSLLQLAIIILALMLLILLFLFTSVEVPLNLTPIHLRPGHFSIALTTSLLASLFLPPSLFWAVYLLILCLSPWQHIFFLLLKHFFRLFTGALNLIPTYFITIAIQDEESANPGSEFDVELGQDMDDG
ncbi:pentatricopeptide repeat-containing protein [Corchorus capsularis]|uniref:Pentatricopeptide repeat-containing protein n=1 Tax=Corchorus capsularis TaxID=210143 RepID=A0A1R3JEY0_COCAP|nr:pentatricopeptide repeat-containing protein [Corchorus capsularis]